MCLRRDVERYRLSPPHRDVELTDSLFLPLPVATAPDAGMAWPFRLSLSLTNFLRDCVRRDDLSVQVVAFFPTP